MERSTWEAAMSAASATSSIRSASSPELSGRIEWEHSKPNGQAYRAYDLSRLKGLGFKPAYSLRAGLEETWNWYCAEND
jgi:nucleoside-diphosphate-sugar epimerase